MDTIKVGDLFTVSKNKAYSSRSYIENVWRCVSETETQIWATSEAGDFWGKSGTGKGEPRCFCKHEYDFFRCGENVLRDINAQHQPESQDSGKQNPDAA